jgi:hypothetical protein
MNETLQKHSINNTKHSIYKYTYYQNTPTYTHPHVTKQVPTKRQVKTYFCLHMPLWCRQEQLYFYCCQRLKETLISLSRGKSVVQTRTELGFSVIFVYSSATSVLCAVVHHEDADSSCNKAAKCSI